MTWPDPARFAVINQALEAALERGGADRADWIAQWCEAHPALAGAFAELLQAAEEDETRVTTPLTGALVEAMSMAAGARLGDWRLLKRIGQGGMAEVWLARGEGAHQDQRAALKRPLLPGVLDAGAQARFRAERRRLAALDDARIARLIDSGMDAEGQPWFAMEYVDGQRIDHWCDARSLDAAARVRWLREVALAVHAAHQALVVHRDLKPANVLVTCSNPQVKLLDFGIAKDLDGDDAPTLQPALTPQYASPEQLLGGAVTVASDVYQLGLLLYELVSGCRAFECRTEPATDPPALQARFVALADGAQRTLAARRSMSVTALKRALGGDLAAIVAQATARAPRQRYLSAAALADDLEAWLAGRPVRARVPTAAYRLARFLSRNRRVATLVAGLLLLSAVAIGLGVQQARQRIVEARAALTVQHYLINLLRQADPLFSGKPEAEPGPLLDAALGLARRELPEQPGLLADVLQVGADAFIRRGDYRSGSSLLAEALDLPLPPRGERRLQLLARLGQSLHYQARYAEAEASLRAALPLSLAAGHAGNLAVPSSLVDVLHSRGDYNAALAVLEQTEPATDRAYARFVWQRDLGTVLRDAGRVEEAHAALQAALASSRSFPGDQGSVGTVLLALSRWHALAGDAGACSATAWEGLAIARAIYGEHQAVPGMFRHNLALAAELEGRPAAAVALLTDVLERDYARVAPGNVLIGYAHLDRAWSLGILGADTGPDLRAARAVLAAVHPAGHPRLAEAELLEALSSHLVRQREAALARAHALRTAALGADHPLTVEVERWRQHLLAGAPAAGKSLLWRRMAVLQAGAP